MTRIYADRGITVRCDIDPDMFVACTEEDVDEILGNLIDNAFKWAAGVIQMSGRTEGSMIVIIIEVTVQAWRKTQWRKPSSPVSAWMKLFPVMVLD